MVTMQEINEAIMFGNLSNDQLNSIAHSIKFARSQLAKRTKNSLTIGTKVKFVNNHTGQYEIGNVKEIKTKNVIVNVGMTNWRVPANMLEVV